MTTEDEVIVLKKKVEELEQRILELEEKTKPKYQERSNPYDLAKNKMRIQK